MSTISIISILTTLSTISTLRNTALKMDKKYVGIVLTIFECKKSLYVYSLYAYYGEYSGPIKDM